MSEFDVLDKRDLTRAVQLLPRELVTLCEAHNHDPKRPIIGGGIVRAAVSGERVSDVDVFTTSPTVTNVLAGEYLQAFGGSGTSVPTDNAITCLVRHRPAVQFIKRWSFPDAQLLIQSFDFSIARAAIWYAGGEWLSVCDHRFYRDLAARRLVYMQPKDNTAGGTLLRIGKFLRRGYRISAFQTATIVVALGAQAGASAEIGEGMMRLIREVDPRSPEWLDPADVPSTPVENEVPSDDDELF